jgi:Thioredoxin like C-terminal domain
MIERHQFGGQIYVRAPLIFAPRPMKSSIAAAANGSGASGDFGPEKARSRAEDRQTAKQICFNLSRFQSLTRPTREASAAHIRTVVRRCTRTLIRQSTDIADHTFSIEFFDDGVQAYAFTFG